MTTYTNESEALDPDPQTQLPSDIQEATVGWEGSPEVVELGTESGDGMTLVRVTLKLGHPVGAPQTEDGLFNGARYAVRPMGPIWRTPVRGERVIVLFPGGDWDTPGNGVLLGTVGASPSARFGRKKTVMDFGDSDVVITGKSVALVSESTAQGASEPSRYVVSVDPRGGAQIVADGSGFFAKDGEVVVKTVSKGGDLMSSLNLLQGEASLMETSGTTQAGVVLSGGDVAVSGGAMNFVPSTSFSVGLTASPATPALVGMSGVAGIPSTFIFFAVSP